MPSNTIKARLTICNKTSTEFSQDTTTVWLKGEMLIESDTRKVKVGDGVNKYADLAYINLTPEEVNTLVNNTKNSTLDSAKSYTDTKISSLINGAPETMDTLKEVADAIAAHQDVTDALNAAIGTKANASDLTAHTKNTDIHVTTANKTNWDKAYAHSTSAHAPSNAERNTIVSVKVNGTALTPDANRAVDVSVPTKVSQLTNDSGYKTTDNNTTYTLGVAANSATNGNAKVRLTAGGSGSGVQEVTIKGTGATSVTTDTNGAIVVNSTDTKYTHPTHTAYASGLYKVTVNNLGHVTAATEVVKSDITGLGIPGQDTTYSVMTGATSNAAGTSGLVPAPASGKQDMYLRGDGTWATPLNTTYGPAGSSLGLVKTGGDVTIADGIITVNDGSHNHTIANVDGLQTALDGKAATNHGTHVTYGTDAPKAAGTASAGSASTVSRSDHVHPVQTTISGNAGSATKLATARTIAISGGATGTATSFNGTANITIPVTSLNAMNLNVADGDTLIIDGNV